MVVHCEIAPVEHGVDIRAQQESIVHAMLSALGYWMDVGGLKCRKDRVPCDGAAAVVGLLDDCLERPLAKARGHESLRTSSRTEIDGHGIREVRRTALGQNSPRSRVDESVFARALVRLSLDGVGREARGCWELTRWWEEVNVSQEDAANLAISN